MTIRELRDKLNSLDRKYDGYKVTVLAPRWKTGEDFGYADKDPEDEYLGMYPKTAHATLQTWDGTLQID